MPALVQKPATAQISDSRCRSAGVRPNSVTITVDSTSTPIVSALHPEALRQESEHGAAEWRRRRWSRPARRPPTTRAKPMSTTIFGIHFTMK